MANNKSNRLVRILLGGAVVAIAVLLGVVAWLLADARGAGDGSDSADSVPGLQQPVPPPQIEVVSETVGDIRLEAPQEIFWYPITDSNPETFTETTSSGFTRDEMGAGLAAAHFYQRMSGLERGSVETIESHSLGDAKQQWLLTIQEARDILEAEGLTAEVAQELGQSAVVGWDVEFWSPQSSTVNLAVLAADTKLSARVEVTWFDDDWRVVIPTTTGTPGHARVVLDWPALDVDLSEAFQ